MNDLLEDETAKKINFYPPKMIFTWKQRIFL